MIDPDAIIEAAARQIRILRSATEHEQARAVLTAVTPLIEAVVLKKAAKVGADACLMRRDVFDAIYALIPGSLQMNHEAIIEAAEHALDRNVEDISMQEIEEAALAVLAAVTPLIRAAALEEAAKVAEEQVYYPDTNIGMRQQWVKDQIAAKVRALKEQP